MIEMIDLTEDAFEKCAVHIPIPRTRRLTRQQKKIKELSKVAEKCLRGDQGRNTRAMYECIRDEAATHL